MEILTKSKSDVSNELNKSKEDNEELKFQVSTPYRIFGGGGVDTCDHNVYLIRVYAYVCLF